MYIHTISFSSKRKFHLCGKLHKQFICNMPRILAIDFGTKRTGIAVTDSLQMIANPLKTVPGDEVLPFLKQYMSKEQVETIVVGEPKHMDGTASGPQEALTNFVRSLEKAFPMVKVVRMDERFTSKMAFGAMLQAGASKKQRQDKSTIDTVSAVIILQSYMEQKAFGKS
jgi:putative Holliday junction resolvase